MEPQLPYDNLDAKPFQIPCEQSENIERSRQNEVSGQIFSPVENSSSAVWT